MKFFVLLLGLTPTLALAQTAAPTLRAGVYRSAADFRRQRLAPAGLDARYVARREAVAVTVPRGLGTGRVLVPKDSVWGFADDGGRTWRHYRGDDYRLEQADTLTIYSLNHTPLREQPGNTVAGTAEGLPGQYTIRQYYFSWGLSGQVLPLSTPVLRKLFGASNPQFVASLEEMNPLETLTDYVESAKTLRVLALYKASLKK